MIPCSPVETPAPCSPVQTPAAAASASAATGAHSMDIDLFDDEMDDDLLLDIATAKPEIKLVLIISTCYLCSCCVYS